MIDFHLSFDSNSNIPLYVQLYDFVKSEVESGNLEANDKLPSVRQLSKSMKLSRTTIEHAYQQLLLEGYIFSREKSGYYVSDIGYNEYTHPDVHYSHIENQIPAAPDEYSMPGYDEFLDEGNFDFICWKKYYGQVLQYQGKRLLTYGDLQGEPELRKEIAKYAYKSRGVQCDADSIIVGAGIQSLIHILSVILKKEDIYDIAFEEPGFTDVRHIFKDHSFNIIPLTLTTEGGISVDMLEDSSAKACHVSPSHQFPTGTVMPVKSRLDLLEWASSNNSYIIEDDYDSELRYSGRPVPSLKGLDKNQRVIYMGSFSTLFLPSLRISYMVLPPRLLSTYKTNKNRYNQTSSKIEQLAFALYMEEGQFERHLRRIRKRFEIKYFKFRQRIEDSLRNTATILPSDSGINILINIDLNININELITRASANGLHLKHIKDNMIVVQFSLISDNKIESVADIIKNELMKCLH